MKSDEVFAGRTYRAKIAGRAIQLLVDRVASTETETGGMTYVFHCTETKSGKKHVLRQTTQFIDEVVPVPQPGQLAQIVSGKHRDGIGVGQVFRVEAVEGKTIVLVNGKDLLRVPVKNVRVAGTALTPPRKPVPIVAPAPPPTKKDRKGFVVMSDAEAPVLPPPAPVAPPVPTRPVSSRLADRLARLSGPTGKITTEGEEGSDPPLTLSARPATRPPASVEKTQNSTTGSSTTPIPQVPTTKPTPAAKKWDVIPDGASEDVSKNGPTEFEKAVAQLETPPFPLDYEVEEEAFRNPPPVKVTGKLASKIGQKKVHRDNSPHLIVEARAGTGKTTTLVEGIKRVLGLPSPLVPSPQQAKVWEAMELSRGKVDSICFTAFNSAIAAELQQRVPKGVAAMTMHSMGNKAVRAVFGHVKMNNFRVGNILTDLLHYKEFRQMRDSPKVFAMVQNVEKMVELCKMNLTNPKLVEVDPIERQDPQYVPRADEESQRLLDLLASHYDVELNGTRDTVYSLVPQVLERCKLVKRDNEIDFADMIWLPVVLDLPVTKYDLLLVDEAQDLNRCQQALAKKAGHRIILCGDPRQAIYGFAGADAESMPRMFEELNADARTPMGGCMRLPLTVTRRCGKAIVDEARKLVPDFEAFEANGPGKVSEARYPDQKGEVVRWDKTEEGKSRPVHEIIKVPVDKTYLAMVEDGDFILCRVNAPLVSQCFRFLKAGRRATIQGRDIGKGLVTLVQKLKATDVVDLVRKLSDWYQQEERKENAKRNPNEARLIALEDKYSCLLAFTEGFTRVEEVTAKIEAVFTDDGKVTGIRLSSIHRAKGLEADRVFFLIPEGATCPHPMAKSAWQVEQEYNLKYVAITRTIEELVYVT